MRLPQLTFIVSLSVLTALLIQRSIADIPIEFNRDVRPILSDKCFACHGADPKSREAELRLDTEESLLKRGDEPAVIVPGQPNESRLMERILSSDESLLMPPRHTNKPLLPSEIETLRRWLEQGAKYEKHWSFEPPRSEAPPAVSDQSRVLNPIDAFIQSELTKKGLTSSEQTDKPTLIRRVAFALTGLPPSLDEQERYFQDVSAQAYESMVERYLESDRYGEEMARHWLDVARYADTHGLHLDNERQMWAYRDWVIRAFNRNLPFDQFTIQQLAGDLLPNPSQDELIATGFNRCNVTTSEGGSIDSEYLYRYAVDRTSTTMQTWLGLTGGCAVCHDHKFDPISQREFYSMYAFFYSAADPAMDGNALLTQPTMKLDRSEERDQLNAINTSERERIAERDEIASRLTYLDPATIEPRPTAVVRTVDWLDDAFPPDGTVVVAGAPTQFVEATEAIPAKSGSKILKRTEGGLAQDVWESKTSPLQVLPNGRFFAHVWLDPNQLPRSIMVQFHREGWNHRAVWGDYQAIEWGKVDSHERVNMGPLPEGGKWVKLEFPWEVVGLQAADKLVGFALTQHGGTVYWDHVGQEGIVDPANDPRHSLQVWQRNVMSVPPEQVPEEIRPIIESVKSPANNASSLSAEQLAKLRAYYLSKVCVDTIPQFDSVHKAITELQNQRKKIEEAIPGTFIYRDLPTPRESFVMMRGAYDKPGEKVTPDVLKVLPPLDRNESSTRPTRLDLARWLVSGKNPLTARVTVNRFWQQIFGTGLVKTSYDFGSQGELPSHPALLDWLAETYQQSGWDTKQLIKLLVMSHTFRQSSKVLPVHLEVDPANRFYARGPRFRLDAEPLRDNALYVGGLLDLTMGGKGVKPYQPPNIWEPVGFVGSNTRSYTQDKGSALYRRSIYTFLKRTAPPPFMSNFDAPNREQFCTVRERSNTPMQALQLMNDVQQIEAARNLAQRLMKSSAVLESQIQLAYRLVLSRSANEREVRVLTKLFEDQKSRFETNPDWANQFLAYGDTKRNETLDPKDLAALTMLCSTLLNLDEVANRN